MDNENQNAPGANEQPDFSEFENNPAAQEWLKQKEAPMKNKVNELLGETKNAKNKAKQWEDLGFDPEDVKELLQERQQADEAKKREEGRFEELISEMKLKHEADLKARDEKYDRRLNKEKEAHVTREIATACQDKDVEGKMLMLEPYIKSVVEVVELDSGELVTRIKGKDGNYRIADGQGNYMTVKDLLLEMRQDDNWGGAFKSSGVQGGGATKGASSQPGAKQPKSPGQVFANMAGGGYRK